MSIRPSRTRKAAIAPLSESQGAGLLALVEDNAADVAAMLDLAPEDLEAGTGADPSAGHGVLVTRLREVMGVNNVEGLLARFFQAKALAAHCEERMGASGKGGVPVLAARIARAWAKPGFEPLAAAHAAARAAPAARAEAAAAAAASHAPSHAADRGATAGNGGGDGGASPHAGTRAEAAAEAAAAAPHAPAADRGATGGDGSGDGGAPPLPPQPVSGAKRGGDDLGGDGGVVGAKCAKAGGPGAEEDEVRAAAAVAVKGGGEDGGGAEAVGAGGGGGGQVHAAVVAEGGEGRELEG
ncbi:hypothetical protein FOA52_007087 [Chlamydomonas sp. UWO 241]|nr:hypothetical protein FOA52_007087 [Chlamydomonas sp. UWO 241]